MRVFVTGGSGYVGSAVVRELVGAGHRVTGLARSDVAAARLAGMGAETVRGELGRPEEFADVAGEHDAVVHVAQDGEAEDRLEADRRLLEAVLGAARRAGGERAFVYTSNVFLLGDQGERALGEDDALPGPPRFAPWRLRVEREVLAAGDERVATAVVRPGQVYGGDGGTLPMMWEPAAAGEAAPFVGEGRNRWSMVHRADLARLFLRVVETRARGTFHGVDGQPMTVAAIARAASEAAGAGGRTRAIPLEEARRDLGGFADMLALDVAALPVRARALGWEPRYGSFPDGAAAAFAEWKAER